MEMQQGVGNLRELKKLNEFDKNICKNKNNSSPHGILMKHKTNKHQVKNKIENIIKDKPKRS